MKQTFSSVDLMVLLSETKAILEKMTPEERVDFFGYISQDYCRFCGYKIEGICNCTNDK